MQTSLVPGPLFQQTGLNRCSTPVGPRTTPNEIKEKFKRCDFHEDLDWPPDSPTARTYDVTNTSAKMLMVSSNKERISSSPSRLRGYDNHQRPPSGNPTRHFPPNCPTKNVDRHRKCNDSSTPVFAPSTNLKEAWVNSTARPAIRPQSSRHQACQVSTDPPLRSLERQKERPQRGVGRVIRRPPLTVQNNPNLIHPKMSEGDKRCMYFIANTYDITNLKRVKQLAYRDLLMRQQYLGFHKESQYVKYMKYLEGPRKRGYGDKEPLFASGQRQDSFSNQTRPESAPVSAYQSSDETSTPMDSSRSTPRVSRLAPIDRNSQGRQRPKSSAPKSSSARERKRQALLLQQICEDDQAAKAPPNEDSVDMPNKGNEQEDRVPLRSATSSKSSRSSKSKTQSLKEDDNKSAKEDSDNIGTKKQNDAKLQEDDESREGEADGATEEVSQKPEASGETNTPELQTKGTHNYSTSTAASSSSDIATTEMDTKYTESSSSVVATETKTPTESGWDRSSEKKQEQAEEEQIIEDQNNANAVPEQETTDGVDFIKPARIDNDQTLVNLVKRETFEAREDETVPVLSPRSDTNENTNEEDKVKDGSDTTAEELGNDEQDTPANKELESSQGDTLECKEEQTTNENISESKADPDADASPKRFGGEQNTHLEASVNSIDESNVSSEAKGEESEDSDKLVAPSQEDAKTQGDAKVTVSFNANNMSYAGREVQEENDTGNDTGSPEEKNYQSTEEVNSKPQDEPTNANLQSKEESEIQIKPEEKDESKAEVNEAIDRPSSAYKETEEDKQIHEEIERAQEQTKVPSPSDSGDESSGSSYTSSDSEESESSDTETHEASSVLTKTAKSNSVYHGTVDEDRDANKEPEQLESVGQDDTDAVAFIVTSAIDADKNLVNEVENEVFSGSDEQTQEPKSSDEPGEEPTSSDEPVEEPKSSDEPVEEPKSSDEPVEEPKSSDEPAEEPKPSDEPVKVPKANDEPVQEPKSSEEPAEKPKTSDEPVDEPKSSDEPAEEPKSSDEAAEEPKSSDEPADEPKLSDEPAEEPKTSDEPTEEPKSSDEAAKEPKSSDEPAEEPKSSDEAVEEPKSSDERVEEPSSTSEQIEEPNTSNELVEESKLTDEAVEELKSSDKPAEEPKSSDEPVKEYKTSDESVEEPKSTDGPREEPTTSDEPTEEPKSSDEPAEETKSSDEPFEEVPHEPEGGPVALSEPTEGKNASEVEINDGQKETNALIQEETESIAQIDSNTGAAQLTVVEDDVENDDFEKASDWDDHHLKREGYDRPKTRLGNRPMPNEEQSEPSKPTEGSDSHKSNTQAEPENDNKGIMGTEETEPKDKQDKQDNEDKPLSFQEQFYRDAQRMRFRERRAEIKKAEAPEMRNAGLI